MLLTRVGDKSRYIITTVDKSQRGECYVVSSHVMSRHVG